MGKVKHKIWRIEKQIVLNFRNKGFMVIVLLVGIFTS